MNRMLKWLVVLACPVVAVAQTASSDTATSGGSASTQNTPYRPVVPSASTNVYGGSNGWWGHSGAATAAGSALNGMASVISAKGDYNLATSAAAVNLTQAQRNAIENRQQWTNTYFEMREVNRQSRAAERGPTPTMEQLARIAREGAPKPLSADQFDRVDGKLAWPGALQDEEFAVERKEIDQLFAEQAKYGGLSYSDQKKARKAVDEMVEKLKSQIADMPPQEYTTCRGFLNSVGYAATKTELQ